jgi:hypothetical protein
MVSTATISSVALAGFALMRRRFDWSEITFVARDNWRLAAFVFLGVLVWEFWWQKTRPPPRLSDQPREGE